MVSSLCSSISLRSVQSNFYVIHIGNGKVDHHTFSNIHIHSAAVVVVSLRLLIVRQHVFKVHPMLKKIYVL